MNAPLLVVGGGPAGASCALALAAGGQPVKLLERGQPGAAKVCGEFLGPEAISALDRLGFPWSQAEAVDYRQLRLRAGSQLVEAPLPHRGRGVRRSFLDAWLLASARRAGAEVVTETLVRKASWDSGRARFELRTAAGDCLETSGLFLATGKHALGDFHARQARDGGRLVGLKVDLVDVPARLCQAYADTLELFFVAGGYGGVARVSTQRLTVCLVLERARARPWSLSSAALLERLGDELPALAALRQATLAQERPLAVAPLPYGHIEPSLSRGAPPLFALGDQFAVLPSLTGTGIGLALATGQLAARAWLTAGAAGLAGYVASARTTALRVRRRALPLHRLVQHPPAARLGLALLRRLPALASFAAGFTRLGPLAEEG